MKSIFKDSSQDKNLKPSNNKLATEKYSLSDDTNDNEKHLTLSLNDIIATIPKNAVKKEDYAMKMTHTEWRWRFFNINGRKMIEISKADPHMARLYMNNMGKWISSDINNNFDKYVVKVIYCYVNL